VHQGLAGWRDKSGRQLDEYLRETGVFRLKMTNKSTQARKSNESAGYVAMRHDQDPRVGKSLNFNVWWAHPLAPSDKRWRVMMDFQRLNHFPGTFCIGRKDRLTNCLSRFRRRVGSVNCDFYPRTYLLPAAYKQWRQDFNNGKGIWIYKPGAAARGIGIKVVTKLEQISKNKCGIVQVIPFSLSLALARARALSPSLPPSLPPSLSRSRAPPSARALSLCFR
jgi:hypothetical protein